MLNKKLYTITKKILIPVNASSQFIIFHLEPHMGLKFQNRVPNLVKFEANGVTLKKQWKFYLTSLVFC